MVRLTSPKLDFSHSRHTPLTPAAEKILSARVRAGDRAARDRLVNANMKFVVSVARRYMGRGLPFEDLVSEGAVGLIAAATKYDPNMSVRFVSYAVWWIRQAMVYALQFQVNDIRTPALSQLQRESSLIAATKDQGKIDKNEERMTQINLLRSPASVEKMTEIGFEIADVYADPTAELEIRDQQREVDRLLAILPLSEQAILRRCYGVGQGVSETLREVGNTLGQSHERIRQRKEKGLRLIRRCIQTEAVK